MERPRIALPFATSKAESRSPTTTLLREQRLRTVCDAACCPNRNHCYSNGTATFLLLGEICTRSCRFCAIESGRPGPVDSEEPQRVAATAKEMGLTHVVLTSVDRDDIADGGSSHYIATITAIRHTLPQATIEVLTPDFRGNDSAWQSIFAARPDVLNHNLETVRSLHRHICPQHRYDRSLAYLAAAAEAGLVTKSGFQLGMGESSSELCEAIAELRSIGVSLLTLGHYYPPTAQHATLKRHISEQEFAELADYARSIGFARVEAGSRVRSSYHAAALDRK